MVDRKEILEKVYGEVLDRLTRVEIEIEYNERALLVLPHDDKDKSRIEKMKLIDNYHHQFIELKALLSVVESKLKDISGVGEKEN